ncbi:unnamed protein product [Musa hybrid cultivar]
MKLDPFIHIQVVRLVQIVDKEMASKCGANWQKTQVHMICSSLQRTIAEMPKWLAACLPITGHTVRRTTVYICALVCVPFTRREWMTEEPY